MMHRHPLLPAGIVLALSALGCSSSDTASDTTSPTSSASTPPAVITSPTVPPSTVPPSTEAPSTPAPGPSTTVDTDRPTTIVEELDPVDSVQGGNVEQVYGADDFPTELSGIIDSVIADAAERSGVAAADIEVEAVALVTWSDTSLGCGQPGFSYAQVVTDGMRIVLAADGRFYDYRVSGVDSFFLCGQSATLPGRTESP